MLQELACRLPVICMSNAPESAGLYVWPFRVQAIETLCLEKAGKLAPWIVMIWPGLRQRTEGGETAVKAGSGMGWFEQLIPSPLYPRLQLHMTASEGPVPAEQ